MTSFKSPPAFVTGKDPASAWALYKERYEIYAVAAKLDKESIAQQRATFLHILGSEGHDIYKTLPIVEVGDQRTVPVIFAAFDSYYQPYKNLTFLRYTFFNIKQESTQTFDQFFTSLKLKARDCEFSTLMNSLIATQIVCGIRDDNLRKTLLSIPTLTLDEAVQRCQAEEVSSKYAVTMSAPTDMKPVSTDNSNETSLDALHRQRPQYHSRAQSHRQHHQSTFNRGPPAFRPPMSNNNNSYRRFHTPPSILPPQRGLPPNLGPTCPSCGHPPHASRPCPARFSTCVKCHRRGHWAIVCRSAHALQEADFVQEPYPEGDSYFVAYPEEDYYDQQNSQQVDDQAVLPNEHRYNCYSLTISRDIHQLDIHPVPDDEIYDSVYLFRQPVTFKIDTGAQVNIIPYHVYETLQPKQPLRAPAFTVMAYSKHPVPMQGVLDIPCTSYTATAVFPFYVTKGNRTPILGASAAVQLGIIQHHSYPLGPTPTILHDLSYKTVATCHTAEATLPSDNTTSMFTSLPHTPQEIISQFHTVFDKVGRLPGVHQIQLKDHPIPVISAAHQVPYAYRDAVRKELDRMQQLGIIVPVTGPSDWVHPMVVQPKPDGSVRICLDPRALNASVKRQPYPVPTSQEIFSSLSGKKIFTVLDVQSAFWHIPLTETSSYLCTFATPYGRFRYLRYPNGLVTGSEVCQQTLRHLFPQDEFPEVNISTDDFLIASTDMSSHKLTLYRVLQRAHEVGLCFGRKKMALAVDRVKYIGHIVTAQGVEVNPERVAAICALPPPKDKSALQKFLGMINYITRFIPGVNTDTAPLRTLLRKDTIFCWEPDHQQHYDSLKRLATSAPVLAYFDPKKPITLSVDSSQSGMGAVLLQDGQPVEYASTSLTPTQCRYAQIEKELLAIVFACEHFHFYIAGTRITVQTDHNPLLGIIKKPIHLLSPRLQRLLMRIFRYQMDLHYVPGSQLHIADMLSRAPQPHNLIDTASLDGPFTAVYNMTTLPAPKYQQYTQATIADPILQQVAKFSKSGWPRILKQVQPELRPYWPHQDEIHTMGDLLYRGTTLVVPKALQSEVLREIHGSHQGITSCLAKARLNFFWPGMSADLTRFIQACGICLNRSRANAAMPMHPHPIPDLPWETVGTDLFHVKSQNFILLVDYYSKFIEAQELHNTNTQSVINFLNPHFARHGAPQRLISDNGPPFNSSEFKQFLLQWGVTHVTSSPHFPQSNGMTERAIQTIKNALIKARQEGKDLSYVLMQYRTTPKGLLPSPAEMCMGRRIRTPLTTHKDTLRPRFSTKNDRQILQSQQDSMVSRHNNSLPNNLAPLHVGQQVLYLNGSRNWLPAKIISIGPEPRSYIIRTSSNQMFRRTRVHLKRVTSYDTPTSMSLNSVQPPLIHNYPASPFTSPRNASNISTVHSPSHTVPMQQNNLPAMPSAIHNNPASSNSPVRGTYNPQTDFTPVTAPTMPGNYPKLPRTTQAPSPSMNESQYTPPNNFPTITSSSTELGPPRKPSGFATQPHQDPATVETPWPTTRSGRAIIPPLRFQNS